MWEFSFQATDCRNMIIIFCPISPYSLNLHISSEFFLGMLCNRIKTRIHLATDTVALIWIKKHTRKKWPPNPPPPWHHASPPLVTTVTTDLNNHYWNPLNIPTTSICDLYWLKSWGAAALCFLTFFHKTTTLYISLIFSPLPSLLPQILSTPI